MSIPLTLNETLIAEARKRAAVRKLSLQRYVEEALERAIAEDAVSYRPRLGETTGAPRSWRDLRAGLSELDIDI